MLKKILIIKRKDNNNKINLNIFNTSCGNRNNYYSSFISENQTIPNQQIIINFNNLKKNNSFSVNKLQYKNDSDENINIFGNIFVKNNKNKVKIISNNKQYDLTDKLKIIKKERIITKPEIFHSHSLYCQG